MYSQVPIVDWVCPDCEHTFKAAACPRPTECPRCGGVPKRVGEPEPQKLTKAQERQRRAEINRHYPPWEGDN